MICQYYRSMIEKQADTNHAIESPQLTAHLQQCSACRDYREQLTVLGIQLQSQPAYEISEDQLQHLQAAVMEQLSDESLGQAALCGFTQPKPVTRFHIIRSIAAVLVLAAVAGLSFRVLIPSTSTHETLPTPSQMTSQFSAAMTFPDQLMQSEIQSLRNDTKRMISFLRKCTPSSPAVTEVLVTETDSEEKVN